MRSAHILPFKSLLVVVVASVVSGASVSSAEEPPATDLVAKRFERLGSILNQDTPKEANIASPSQTPSAQPPGRQSSGLHSSSLEPDTSLNSPAQGLTPTDEWRRMFPGK